MRYNIAAIPGDGIGPEVMDSITPLLHDVAAMEQFDLAIDRYDWGSMRLMKDGAMMPDNALEQLDQSDAILVGAVGHPQVPDHVTLHGLLLPIRKQFNQLVCERPSILFKGVESPLRGYHGGDIDFTVFRENTEGEYSDVGGREHIGFSHEVAVQTSVFTRQGTEGIVRFAFERAKQRSGHLTSITKSNAQGHSMVFWDQIVREIASEYPSVRVDSLLVDAGCMELIRRPEEFDVIVASNLFGDILTDIGAIITGSMGLAPSANIDPSGQHPSMFEPVHGSAPDIAGTGSANPLAMLLSAAMMLEHLDEESASHRIRQAVRTYLADTDAPRTPDLGGDARTESVSNEIRSRL